MVIKKERVLRSSATGFVVSVCLFGIDSAWSATADGQSTPIQEPLQVVQGTILPEGTPVRLRIVQTISSSDSQLGENVNFETLDDLKVNGLVVIPKGSTAIATVTNAVPKKRLARGGQLAINIDYLHLPSGEKLGLRGVQSLKAGNRTGAMAGGILGTATASVLLFPFFWWAAPAAPLFLLMHGKDVAFPEGREFTAYTNTDYMLPGAEAAERVQPTIPAKLLSGSPLHNADVLKLKAAGLSDQLIIDKIRASPANFRVDSDDLVELKLANLSEGIIAAMIEASRR
jgi:hypothetical protein